MGAVGEAGDGGDSPSGVTGACIQVCLCCAGSGCCPTAVSCLPTRPAWGPWRLHTLSPETVVPSSAVSLRPRLAQLAALLPPLAQDADRPAPGSEDSLCTRDTASASRLHSVTLLCCSLLWGAQGPPP